MPKNDELTFDYFQTKCKENAVYGHIHSLYYVTLGLTGEAGEVANKVKKLIRDHGGVLDDELKNSIKLELGDVLWYAAMIAHELDISFNEVALSNIEKLAERKRLNQLHGDGDKR